MAPLDQAGREERVHVRFSPNGRGVGSVLTRRNQAHAGEMLVRRRQSEGLLYYGAVLGTLDAGSPLNATGANPLSAASKRQDVFGRLRRARWCLACRSATSWPGAIRSGGRKEQTAFPPLYLVGAWPGMPQVCGSAKPVTAGSTAGVGGGKGAPLDLGSGWAMTCPRTMAAGLRYLRHAQRRTPCRV